MEIKNRKNRTKIALIIFPIIISIFIFGGLIIGYYFEEIYGRGIIFPLLFSTIGLIASIISLYFLARFF
jgi:uncharacterized ion transporter superfamily protein YfcC|tara:strand:+ start:126 stop:332 length:207 start_codon:yes stop_codon:yes gene_type:complete